MALRAILAPRPSPMVLAPEHPYFSSFARPPSSTRLSASGGHRRSPLPPPQPQSVLQTHPLLTVYGRSFGVAPVLGLLGELNSFDELERSVEPWTSAMSELAEAPVMVAPHLIYGLAIPCQDADDSCVIFLDASGVDLIEDYIKPAADRGMAVFLDTQIGRLHPTYFVQRNDRRWVLGVSQRARRARS